MRVLKGVGWLILGGSSGVVLGLVLLTFFNLPWDTNPRNPDALLWWIAGGVALAIASLYLVQQENQCQRSRD